NNMPGRDEEPYTMSVIGVIEDFHMASLHEKIEPLFVQYDPSQWHTLTLKLNPANTSATLLRLQKKWLTLVPDRPFDYIFLDDRLEESYQQEQELRSLTLAFSVLAIFIGCLGLFGMSSFTATSRTKEIGIRKVLGASVPTIVKLLSLETIALILIASLVAYPIAWYAMSNWLETFAFRVPFNWLIPVLISAGTVVLAIFTVSYQSIKAALANPVKSLRYE
ncbi:MAG: FtsX-like permease family protein, partial [Candidatus Marinimicrobia bacterium]|nr:FtsX-like permease family protein [Candidatus Neomarinimicrobiota bacterium]